MCIQTVFTVWKCPNWGKICFALCDLDLWSLTLIFGMDITPVNVNYSWKFHDDTMTGWKSVTYRRTARDRQDRSESCLVTAKNLWAYWSTTGMLIYLAKTTVHGNDTEEPLSKYHLSCLNVRWSLTGENEYDFLTHWGRVTDKCVSKLIIIGLDNGLSPGRCHAIIWINAGILLTGSLQTNFSENLTEILIL